MSDADAWRWAMVVLSSRMENGRILMAVDKPDIFRDDAEAVSKTGSHALKMLLMSTVDIALLSNAKDREYDLGVLYVDLNKLPLHNLYETCEHVKQLQLKLKPGSSMAFFAKLNKTPDGRYHSSMITHILESCYLVGVDPDLPSQRFVGRTEPVPSLSIDPNLEDDCMAVWFYRRKTREELYGNAYFDNSDPKRWWWSPGRYKMLSDLTLATSRRFLSDDELKSMKAMDVGSDPRGDFAKELGEYCSWDHKTDVVNLNPDDFKQYDIITAWQLFEHLDPIDVPVALAKLRTAAPKLLFVGVSDVNIQEHFSVHPTEWWVKTIINAGFTYIGNDRAFNALHEIWDGALKSSDEIGFNKNDINQERRGFLIFSSLSMQECASRIWCKMSDHHIYMESDMRKPNVNFLINEMNQRHVNNLLVVGTGPELYLGAFADHVNVVDVSNNAIKGIDSNISWMTFGDNWTIPLEDDSQDTICSLSYLPHFPRLVQDLLLAEMSRVLKPGGRLFVHLWPLDSDYKAENEGNDFIQFHAMSSSEARRALNGNGMVIDSIKPMPTMGGCVCATFAPIMAWSNNRSVITTVRPGEPIPMVGVTSVDNGVTNQYPFIGACRSALRMCDRLIIRAGGTDGTLELLQEAFGNNINVTIFQDDTVYDNPFRETKQAALDKARSIYPCARFWYWFDIDEVCADEDCPSVRTFTLNDAPYDLIYFREIMFWKDYSKLLYDDGRVAHAFLIRNREDTKFVGDGFKIEEEGLRIAVERSVKIFHYGICRDLDVLIAKRQRQSMCDGGTNPVSINTTWRTIGEELFPDKRVSLIGGKPMEVSAFCENSLLPFLGNHPEFMELADNRKKRVAIIRAAGIGDHVMSETLVRAVGRAFKSNGFDIDIDYYFNPAYGGYNNIPSQFILQKHPDISFSSPNLMELHPRKPELLLWCDRVTDARHTEPVIDAFLRAGGINWAEFLRPDEFRPRLPFTIHHKQLMRQLRDKIGNKFIVGVALGTTDQKKGPWAKDIESFVLELSRDERVVVIVMGEGGDVNRPNPESLKIPRVIDAVGKQSLDQVVATTMACDLMVSNDSASHHIAGALEVPCIGIFTAFNAEYLTAYYSDFIRYQVPCACSPCYKHRGQPCSNNLKCLGCIEWSKIAGWVREAADNWEKQT